MTTMPDERDLPGLEEPAVEPTDAEVIAEPEYDAFDDPDVELGQGSSIDDDDPEREVTSTLALWEGDEGSLTELQRRALVMLLKKRFISAQDNPKEWAALVANPRPIRTRLNDTFMDLRLDRLREVAYKHQVSPEAGGRPYPTLLYDTPWSREETILLVCLRSRHRNEQAGGADRAFIDRASMLEFIAQHRPAHATDLSGDARRATKAVDSVFSAGLLLGDKDGDRFEISGAVEVMLPMEKLHELLAWLREQNDAGPDAGPDAGDIQTAISMPPAAGTAQDDIDPHHDDERREH